MGNGTVLLPPMYMAPPMYYMVMKEFEHAVIDVAMYNDRRYKTSHRCLLKPGNCAPSPSMLSVPVSTDRHGIYGNEWCVSGHGEWYKTHRRTLATLYGSAPYYKYLAEEILEPINETCVGKPVKQLNCLIDANIRRILGIKTLASTTLDTDSVEGAGITDLRQALFTLPVMKVGQKELRVPEGISAVLSVVDALFVHGPSCLDT